MFLRSNDGNGGGDGGKTGKKSLTSSKAPSFGIDDSPPIPFLLLPRCFSGVVVVERWFSGSGGDFAFLPLR